MHHLNKSDAIMLFEKLDVSELMALGNAVKKKIHPKNEVSWIIDRNVNITNVCISGCTFCNFHCKYNSDQAYITTIEEYCQKIEETFALNGDQLLLQGGLHPKLGVKYYEELFHELKQRYPRLKLHALGPPEIVHLANLDKISTQEVLERLVTAGLDSLPGAGAEILVDRVRKQLSKYKCSTNEWLNVMREAHKLGLTTSATMMYGHIETLEERFEHIIRIRDVQSEKPSNSKGFVAFIPWPFQDKGTELQTKMGVNNTSSTSEYIKMIAISRILLPNVNNIQASWLTVGTDIAKLCLYSGANDLGSIMIEENVVSSAGATFSLNAFEMQNTIKEAGFKPIRRNQQYDFLSV